VAPNYVGDFVFGIQFNPDGTLSGSIHYSSYNDTIMISGSEFDWSGTMDSDGPFCFSAPCQVSGYFEAVPEPASWQLFAAALLGLGFFSSHFAGGFGRLKAG
jgi:hypothetical protein